MNLVVVAIITVLVDQLTKYIISADIPLNTSIPIVENVFHITYILNAGAAFGMLEDSRWFFVAMAVLVLAAFVYYRRLILSEDMFIQYGCALFAGGALGNLIDRIHTGLVIDFFDFRIWPIFNVADIAICVGVGCIIWSVLMETKKA